MVILPGGVRFPSYHRDVRMWLTFIIIGIFLASSFSSAKTMGSGSGNSVLQEMGIWMAEIARRWRAGTSAVEESYFVPPFRLTGSLNDAIIESQRLTIDSHGGDLLETNYSERGSY